MSEGVTTIFTNEYALAALKEWALRRIRDTQHLRPGQGMRAALIAPLEEDDDEDIKAETMALPEEATANQTLTIWAYH